MTAIINMKLAIEDRSWKTERMQQLVIQQLKKWSIMAKNENKILDELRRRGKIYEDPAPEVGGFTGWLISLFTKKK